MSLTRRHFLRNMLLAPVVGSQLLNQSAIAATLSPAQSVANALGKTLVVVFQRGGCDGLNTVVPYGDQDYYSARGGSIAIAPPNEGARSALDLDGFFGLHPSMTAMQQIYQAGDMAIMPAVSWENSNRSHFENQAAIESGGKFLAEQGWLNLHLQAQVRNVPLRAVNLGTLAQSMRGNFTVSSISNMAKLGLGESGRVNTQQFLDQDLKQSMETAYHLDHADNPSRNLLHKHGQKMLNNIDVLKDIDAGSYVAENGAVYSGSKLATEFKNAAQLIKSNLGLEVISIGQGGWDTHTKQGGGEENGAQSKKLADLSDSLGAFYTDMGADMKDVMVVVMSEFGRSVKVNANKGTDHGHAAAWFVIGGGVNGSIYGDWPGLATAQLNNGRYLENTIDFRNILGEVMSQYLQNPNFEQALPNFSNYQPVGFMA
ncbi:MAG: DUF1501 domain-containing protein [Mariprofundaceae bacterium]|nr:DUF1501 domain-containing protein [Mariprofundaceae bacterium]